jgi:hypothetical protein
MSSQTIPNLDDFSLTRNGIIYKAIAKLRLSRPSTSILLKRCLVFIVVTWVPLLVLALLQGRAFGNAVEFSFIKDFATHTRFLLVLPLLILAEASVDVIIKEMITQFFSSGILTEEDLPQFDAIKKTISRLTHSIIVELVILLIILANIYYRFSTAGSGIDHWVGLPPESISWAGIWYLAIAVPLLQFILLRWMWRWCCWFLFFLKISKLPLKLQSAHPDLAGGLGFLGLPPSPFIMVNLAIAILISAVIGERIYYLHENLSSYYVPLGGFALLTVLLNVLPLLVFMKPLLKQRRKGILQYSALIQQHHRDFDQKWLDPNNQASLVGDTAASSLADINGSFETVNKMGVVPFNVKIMVSTIAIVILPVLPLLFFEYKLQDILKKIIGLLL